MWKEIPNFPGYEVSPEGEVRSWLREDIHYMTPQLCNRGYHQLNLMKNGKRYRRTVHGMVAAAYLGGWKPKVVNHKNGNKLDNRVDNLEWVTSAENSKHAFDTGLQKSGQDHHHSTVSDSTIDSIRKLKGLHRQNVIAKMLGVSTALVSLVLSGKRRART